MEKNNAVNRKAEDSHPENGHRKGVHPFGKAVAYKAMLDVDLRIGS
jgi:hypothetical protein